MPYLRCTEEECGHEWFERSQLAGEADCVECGSRAVLVGRDEEIDERGDADDGARRESGRPRVRFARDSAQAALKVLDECSAPTPVNQLAAIAGLDVTESDVLPTALRARLVGRTIELASSDSPRGKRFSVAHELGHHRMGTVHGASSRSEIEADHFANELLVPRRLLVAAVQSSTDVRELADLFEVSPQVIEIAAEYHKVKVT